MIIVIVATTVALRIGSVLAFIIISNYLAGVSGIEPLTYGIKTRCSTNWTTPLQLFFLQYNVSLFCSTFPPARIQLETNVSALLYWLCSLSDNWINHIGIKIIKQISDNLIILVGLTIFGGRCGIWTHGWEWLPTDDFQDRCIKPALPTFRILDAGIGIAPTLVRLMRPKRTLCLPPAFKTGYLYTMFTNWSVCLFLLFVSKTCYTKLSG